MMPQSSAAKPFMDSSTIRGKFLSFFESRGHRVVRSSSLVPANDPTLLFSNAGMNQFKDVFLGRETRDYARACSAQKCVRAGGKHNDLEQVGRTTRHHTFFEMLGNFSFGDYFKKEAIPWAWELVTKDFAIPRDKLYITVFREDDEAAGIWKNDVGVGPDTLFRMDEKDNFWAMGDTGPCGPCSEIHYDLGPAASEQGHSDCRFPCECGRYVELWNLVFMQFNRDDQGRMTPLPRPSIDTGAGLERLATVLQGKVSNFDTDLFRPLIDEAALLANVEYGADHETDVSLRIIADHARASTFLISDGVLPSNEGRGYVLRLIMRRALYHGQTLALEEPFLYKMAGHVAQMMKDAYPELAEGEIHIAAAIKAEEEQYARTTRIGLEQLKDARVVTYLGEETSYWAWERYSSAVKKYLPDHLQALRTDPAYGGMRFDKSNRNTPPHGTSWIPGDELFKLHDTFGLRPDFVQDGVRNYGLTVDREGYEAEMQRQRERARRSWKAVQKEMPSGPYKSIAEKRPTHFVGYEQTRVSAEVLALAEREQVSPRSQAVKDWEVILDRTAFYAESGGQVGDTGWLSLNGQTIASVEDTYRPVTGLIVHVVRWAADFAGKPPELEGHIVEAEVDTPRRDAIRRNHTATHLLHAALRRILGAHVKQAGSLVAPDRLRFDFTHYAPLAEHDLLDIEDLVNQHVLANDEVQTNITDLETAVNSGAMALFGEKYADRVRVVSIDEFSKELCGGTHVRRTGDIGLFKVVSEASVAAGTRRIEALTGQGVLDALRRQSETLTALAEVMRSKPEALVEAAEKLADSEKKLRKALEAQQLKRAAASAGDLLEQARQVKGVRVVAARVESMDRAGMRQMVDNLRARLRSGVIVLGSAADGKVSLVAAVSKDLTDRLDAGKIVKAAAAFVEGSGGGRKDLAEAGGKNPAKLNESLEAVPVIIEQMLE
jgi:alanyl-tRNA synthetase